MDNNKVTAAARSVEAELGRYYAGDGQKSARLEVFSSLCGSAIAAAERRDYALAADLARAMRPLLVGHAEHNRHRITEAATIDSVGRALQDFGDLANCAAR